MIGRCWADQLDRIRSLIDLFDFNFDLGSCNRVAFFDALRLDKKVRRGKVRFVLPVDLGQTKTVDSISDAQVVLAMNAIFGEECLL